MDNKILKELLEKQIQLVSEQSECCEKGDIGTLSLALSKLVDSYWVICKHGIR